VLYIRLNFHNALIRRTNARVLGTFK
jgi:hypothetical protein